MGKKMAFGKEKRRCESPNFRFLFYVRSVGSATDRKISRHLSIARDNKTQGVRRLISARNPQSLLGSPRRLQGGQPHRHLCAAQDSLPCGARNLSQYYTPVSCSMAILITTAAALHCIVSCNFPNPTEVRGHLHDRLSLSSADTPRTRFSRP